MSIANVLKLQIIHHFKYQKFELQSLQITTSQLKGRQAVTNTKVNIAFMETISPMISIDHKKRQV